MVDPSFKRTVIWLTKTGKQLQKYERMEEEVWGGQGPNWAVEP
jgi:hypothetical protein